MFEIMAQAGLFPAMYPNSAKMALAVPSGRKRFFQHARKKKSPFSPGANLGGFGLLRNGGKHMFEIMGQAGVDVP